MMKTDKESIFISESCKGETCSLCGRPATNKLEETIFHDDPHQNRHPLTTYVCNKHFNIIIGTTHWLD